MPGRTSTCCRTRTDCGPSSSCGRLATTVRFAAPDRAARTSSPTSAASQKTARRDLAEEHQRRDDVIAACPEIAARAENETSICFPSPIEALEALIELEDLVAAADASCCTGHRAAV